eukprot:1161172-Pelagomonas_calceolata.AAC.7
MRGIAFVILGRPYTYAAPIINVIVAPIRTGKLLERKFRCSLYVWTGTTTIMGSLMSRCRQIIGLCGDDYNCYNGIWPSVRQFHCSACWIVPAKQKMLKRRGTASKENILRLRSSKCMITPSGQRMHNGRQAL